MKNIKYHISIVISFILFNIKRLNEYKVDFFLGMTFLLVTQVLNLAFFYFVFNAVPEIGGWTINEVLLIYGLYTLNLGCFQLLFSNLRSLKAYLFSGDFEIMLIRPISPLFHILISGFNEKSIFQIVLGAIITFYILSLLQIKITLLVIFKIVVFMIIGSGILGAIAVVAETFLFFTRYSFTPIDSIFSLLDFVKYPITIFGSFICHIFTYIIPFGFLSFYPANYFIKKQAYRFNIFFLGISLLCFLWIFAIYVFRKGLEQHEGSGN